MWRVFKRIFLYVRFVYLALFVGGSAGARSLGVRVGEGCRILNKDFGSEPWLVSIGDRVTVAAGTRFITHDGSTWLLHDERGRRYRYAPVKIGNDVFIGMNCLIMAGVQVGNRVIVGAGSVVNRSIPDNCIVAGVPARYIGSFDDYERKGLQSSKCGSDMRGSNDRERIDSIVQLEPAPPIRIPQTGEGDQRVRL